MSRLTEASNRLPIDRQKEIIGKWLDGEQAASEFEIFACDRTDDLASGIDPTDRSLIRDIQRMIVADIAAHGNAGLIDDPLIKEFFERRKNGTLDS